MDIVRQISRSVDPSTEWITLTCNSMGKPDTKI